MEQTRIPVVDDNEMFIEMTRLILGAAAYVVETAADAGQALQRILVFRPDLTLMDIRMPVTDGIAPTRQLKADPATRGITVVACTAYASQGDELGLQAAGFDGYIAKPVDVSTLAAEVRFWLGECEPAHGSRFVWP